MTPDAPLDPRLASLRDAGLKPGTSLLSGATPEQRKAARAEDVAQRRKLVKNKRAKRARKRNRK